MGMSLQPRFLILAASLIVFASFAAWSMFQRVAEGIIEQWGERVAELQVRYDSARLLQPLEREIALSRQMADSQVLRRWALTPEQPELEAAAIQEMESFRRNFMDHSYFVALLASGAYYHNNRAGEFSDQPLRYHLDPDKPDDAWFYQLVREGRDFHLNVNPDVELGVTKLWIDVLMRDEAQNILGIVGTGLELDEFLRDIVEAVQPGITTLFVDYKGAIQLYRDARLIDFASLVKPEGQKSTLDRLFDTAADGERMQRMMDTLSRNGAEPGQVLSDFVMVDGKRHLAGIAYLPTIGWYEVTLLDLDVLMPMRSFLPVALLFALTLFVTLLLFHLALRYLVLKPVGALERAMLKVRDGDLAPAPLPKGYGEIGRLIGHFDAMAESVRMTTRELEGKVRERTDALHRLATVDELTGLTNRRGMNELIAEEIERSRRTGATFGVIWLDVDWFKGINDSLGHGVGDAVLSEVAELLRANIRPYDHAGRWGGDEFLILLTPCDRDTLHTLAERVRTAVERHHGGNGRCPVTVSIGAHLAQPGDDIERILLLADKALYAAKQAGRNAVRLTEALAPEVS